MSSCKRDIDHSSWDVAVITPLVKSSLTIDDILPDSLLQTNTDNSLSLVYSSTFYEASLDSLFQYPDTNIVYTAKLDSLVLGNQSFDTTLTIVDIAMMADPVIALGLVLANGSYMAIPPIDPISSGPIPQDVSEYFETMTLVEGYLDFVIVNDLPIDVTNVIVSLKNQSNNSVILEDTFLIIYAYSSDTFSIDLAGKTIEGKLVAELVNLESPGSNGNAVLIDTSDAVTVSIQMRDLHPSSATAKFPTQNVVNKIDYLPMDKISQELTFIKVKSGTIHVEAVNTLQQELHFKYKIHSATLNGDTFVVENVIPAAPLGGSSSFNKDYDFAGYDLNLTLGATGDTVNTLKQELIGTIDSSGQLVTITLADSFYVNSGMMGIIPEYAYGYMGNDTFSFGPEYTTYSFFENMTGTLDFEDVNVNLRVNNGIGCNAKVDLKQLGASNTESGKSVLLQGTAITQPFIIDAATDNPLTSAESKLTLNDASTNGTASQFFEIIPNQLSYEMQLVLNPGETPPLLGTGTDFIYYDSKLEASLDVEIPLSLIANDLTLSRTLDFALVESDQSKRIKDGELILSVENGFPFEAELQLFMLDVNEQVIDSLFSSNKVAAATMGSNLIVSDIKKSKLTIPVNSDKINKLYQTQYIKIVVSFTTASTTQHVKIYNNYSFDIQLVGDFNYMYEQK